MKNLSKQQIMWLVITAIIIIIIVVAYLVIKKKNKKATQQETTSSRNKTETPKGNDSFPLQKGSYGDNVKYLQTALNKIRPTNNLKVDGDFGTGTYNAILLTMGTSFYPVTTTKFNEILNKSRQ